MNVRIRPATGDDADAVAAVNVVSWQSAYAGLLPADFLAGLDVSARAAHWRELLAAGSGTMLVAESAERIVGFIAVGRDGDQSEVSTGVLYAIYVEPPSLGAGVGHALHEAGLQAMRDSGCTIAGLWVLRGNLRAIAFYERHGWRLDGREQIDHSVPGVELDEIGYSLRL